MRAPVTGTRLAAMIALTVAVGLQWTDAQGPPSALSPAPYTTWSAYGGSADSMQYSALAQITRENVATLQPLWFYRVGGDPARLPFNPLIVGNVMYVAGAKNLVVALDVATGKELWVSGAQAPSGVSPTGRVPMDPIGD